MLDLPDPDWYLDHVLAEVEPGATRKGTPNPVADWRGWWRVQATATAREHPDLAAAARGFVVTTAQLTAAGVPRHRTRRLVRCGCWSAPQPGAVAIVDPASHPGTAPLSPWAVDRRRHALRCAAAAVRNTGFVVSGSSGAVLHGLPTMDVPDAPVLSTPPERHHHFRVIGLTPAETETWYRVPVTTPARTIVDVARHDRRSAIMAADAALRDGMVSHAQLSAALDRARGWFGVVQAREVLGLATPLGESPLESITRLALHDDGFAAPALQVPIGVPGRYLRYRVDMLWREQRLILELDGRGKYTTQQLWSEKRRDRDLERLGYRVERFTWAEIVHGWPGCADRLRSLLAA